MLVVVDDDVDVDDVVVDEVVDTIDAAADGGIDEDHRNLVIS